MKRVTFYITRNRNEDGTLSRKVCVWTVCPNRYKDPAGMWVWWGQMDQNTNQFLVPNPDFVAQLDLDDCYHEYGTIPDTDQMVIKTNRKVKDE